MCRTGIRNLWCIHEIRYICRRNTRQIGIHRDTDRAAVFDRFSTFSIHAQKVLSAGVARKESRFIAGVADLSHVHADFQRLMTPEPVRTVGFVCVAWRAELDGLIALVIFAAFESRFADKVLVGGAFFAFVCLNGTDTIDAGTLAANGNLAGIAQIGDRTAYGIDALEAVRARAVFAASFAFSGNLFGADAIGADQTAVADMGLVAALRGIDMGDTDGILAEKIVLAFNIVA